MKKSLSSNFYQKFGFLLFFGFSFFFNPRIILAQVINPVIGELGQSGDDVSTGGRFIQYAVYLWRAAITLGALAVIAFFLLGAFTWITSGGDKNKVEEARNKITNAIIGLVLLVSSLVLLSFLSKLLFGGEFDILKLTIPGVGNGQDNPLPSNPPNNFPGGPTPIVF